MLDKDQAKRVSGIVKWFDAGRGFGFVTSDACGQDILLHVNVLRNFGQGSVAEGAMVDVAIQVSDRGTQVSEIFSITAPSLADEPILEDFKGLDPSEIKSTPMLPARVKWFDKAKGFGFANIFGSGDDVFLHVEVLRSSGLAALAPGEAVTLRVITGERGLMATEILQWDAAIDASCEK